MRELSRQFMHMFFGILFAYLVFQNVLFWWHIGVLLLISLALMFYIKYTGQHIPGLSHLIKYMGRAEEIPGFGAVMFLLGVTIATGLFPREIAAASIIIMGVGDSISHMGGRFLGKTKSFLSKRKKLEGFFIGFITSFLAALFMVSNTLALTGAFFAMIVEHMDITDFVDDNILIPLTAGIAMTVLQAVIIL
ncbi:hypothetical protein GOV08_02430 [Candidatus Woesearchaeota archaeon]|nr:hypothetical protein [Candidatus Woesearchaeota archaeon]